jgi:heme-degrading monooxygenase HmoA
MAALNQNRKKTIAKTEKIMHARMNMLIGDPARIDEVTHYLDQTVRPHVEAQPGSRGLAVLTDRDQGVTMIASYWETADAMAVSEHAVQTSRKEATELADGVVTVEHYEVPVFVRRSRPQAGAGIRITRMESDPADIDISIQGFRDTAIPGLVKMPGLCSAQFMADRDTGRCLVIAAYENSETLAASRAGVARLRADTLAKTHATVRSVQEFSLLFTSVREGGTNSLTEREAELWNAHDREGWEALFDQQAVEVRAPGGMRLVGRDATDTLWNTWNDAFPDNHLVTVGIYGDARGGVLEGRFTGTNSGTLHTSAGDIPATGKSVDVPFCEVHRVEGGKFIDTHLYFDQTELLTQLGQSSRTS